MSDLVLYLSEHLIVSLFLIIGLGLALGNITVKGFSLGSSAVIFTALLFGHLGVNLPSEIGDLGVILFVYAVGLQAGPRFFRSIQRHGVRFLMIALATLITGAATVWVYCTIFRLSPALGVGLFTGALTSTPGLAAALDVLGDPTVSVGYGISYPFGIIGVVLFVQWVGQMKRTKDELLAEQTQQHNGSNPVRYKQFQVTNPNCTGKSINEIDIHSMTEANITRVRRGERVMVAHADLVLELNDVIRATGTEKELKKLEHIIGIESNVDMDHSGDVVVKNVFVSSPKVEGKSLREMEIKEMFGVVISRLRRDEIELVPTGKTVLEIGDLLYVVGDPEDVESFIHYVGQQERRMHETNILALSAGIVVGAIIGSIPIPLPGGISFNLGLAGGPLLVALLVSHFGRIGRISTRIPYASKYLTREIGLVFFLAAAGTKAGGSFVEVLREVGLQIFLFGAITSTVTMLTAFLVSVHFLRFNNLMGLGVVCGAMTSTPALGAVTSKVDSETPTIAYASIYAIALVLVTVISQILALVL